MKEKIKRIKNLLHYLKDDWYDLANTYLDESAYDHTDGTMGEMLDYTRGDTMVIKDYCYRKPSEYIPEKFDKILVEIEELLTAQ